MPEPLTAAERNRLLGVLGRLESDFDGERAAAALLAARLLAAKGLRWPDVIAAGSPAKPQPKQPGPSWPPQSDQQSRRDWHGETTLCLRHAAILTMWELGFVNDLRVMRRAPTLRQLAKLTDILAKVQVAEARKRREWPGGL